MLLFADANWLAICSNVLFFVSGTKKYRKSRKTSRKTMNTMNVYCFNPACDSTPFTVHIHTHKVTGSHMHCKCGLGNGARYTC